MHIILASCNSSTFSVYEIGELEKNTVEEGLR